MPATTASVDVAPTRPQRAFFRSAARFRAFVGGIGSGKTFAGALEVLRQPGNTIGMVVAPTYTMLRDAAFRTLTTIAEPLTLELNKSDMRLVLLNGTEILFRSADNPDRLRGPNLGWFWMDEGAYCPPETWDILIGRLRLDPGRAWVTTTPRGKNWLYEVFGPEHGRPDQALFRAATRENPHLPAHFVAGLERSYTRQQALQELEGEFVDVAGAVFRGGWIDAARMPETLPEQILPSMVRVVIGVDPAGTHRPTSDETGIVVCGLDRKGDAYVLADSSGRYAPNEWAATVRTLADRWKADRIVVERNFGGEMVEATLRAYGGANLPVKTVSASRGKTVRAEPLAAPYEQGRVHHVGVFADLERQMTGYDPRDTGSASPDRMDALVWALTELLLAAPAPAPSFYSGVSYASAY